MDPDSVNPSCKQNTDRNFTDVTSQPIHAFCMPTNPLPDPINPSTTTFPWAQSNQNMDLPGFEQAAQLREESSCVQTHPVGSEFHPSFFVREHYSTGDPIGSSSSSLTPANELQSNVHEAMAPTGQPPHRFMADCPFQHQGQLSMATQSVDDYFLNFGQDFDSHKVQP